MRKQHTSSDAPRHASEATLGEVLHCEECEATFGHLAALRAHQHVKHGIKSEIRTLIAGSSCPACLKDFWTRDRDLDHLRHAHRCREILEQKGPAVTAEEAQLLDIAARPTAKANRKQECQLPSRESLPQGW